MFKKGHKFAVGGARQNAGRPHDWLRLKCANIIEKKGLIQYLARVASGEETETRIAYDSAGAPYRESVACSTKDRIRAVEMLIDRGFGKADQFVNVSGTVDLRAVEAQKRIESDISGYFEKLGVQVIEAETAPAAISPNKANLPYDSVDKAISKDPGPDKAAGIA